MATIMNFCSLCGQPVALEIPAGDSRPRHVCRSCGHIHYENPKVVVGCVAEFAGRILVCRRAIDPRYGFWTVPAGFMELDESLGEAAIRETWEEARATVDLGPLFAVVDVIQARQVHVFFRGRLREEHHTAGDETLETRLVTPEELPWNEIAFASVTIALERYLLDRESGGGTLHLATAPRVRLR
jgi:ADP-ribose pyrophosphatase YjhB (NUDIX family)